MSINGFSVFEKKAVLVKGYVALLGVVACATGLYFESILTSLIGGVLCGIYISAYSPAWCEPGNGEKDRLFFARLKNGPARQWKFYYWLLPILGIGMPALLIVHFSGIVTN